MKPANDEIAFTGVMAVIPEIPTLEFELDQHSLPPVSHLSDKTLSLAIGEWAGDAFDYEAKIASDHAEQKYHALLVDRSVTQRAEITNQSVI